MVPSFEQALHQAKAQEPKSKTRKPKTAVYEAIEHPEAEHLPVKHVQEIMSDKVVTLDIGASIGEAWRLVQYRHFRHIPGLYQGKLSGIVSDRDILSHTSNLSAIEPQSRLADPIASIMAKRVLAAHPEAEIRLVAGVITGHRIGALPVINDADQLVGIVTRSDILRTLLHRPPLETWT